MCHNPNNSCKPSPGAKYVEALEPVVGVERVEEELTHLRVVHWTSNRIKKDKTTNGSWSHGGVTNFCSFLLHLFPITHVYNPLREENGIEINH